MRPYAPTLGRQVIAKRVSVPLADELKVINKVSQNLHAELVLRLLGKMEGDDGSIGQGARVVRKIPALRRNRRSDFYFYDGSGMSMDDRMTPRAFTHLLRRRHPTLGRGVARNFSHCRRRWHTRRSLHEIAAHGQMQAKRDSQRSQRALRLHENPKRKNPCLSIHCQQSSAR